MNKEIMHVKSSFKSAYASTKRLIYVTFHHFHAVGILHLKFQWILLKTDWCFPRVRLLLSVRAVAYQQILSNSLDREAHVYELELYVPGMF